MKTAIIIESLTGNTWKAGEMIASNLQQENWSITGLSEAKLPDHRSIQEADVVIVGTWVHGLFVVGQSPWGSIVCVRFLRWQGKKQWAFARLR